MRTSFFFFWTLYFPIFIFFFICTPELVSMVGKRSSVVRVEMECMKFFPPFMSSLFETLTMIDFEIQKIIFFSIFFFSRKLPRIRYFNVDIVIALRTFLVSFITVFPPLKMWKAHGAHTQKYTYFIWFNISSFFLMIFFFFLKWNKNL